MEKNRHMEQNRKAISFEMLKKDLMAVIKESQIKLGYARNAIELYYPLESLNRLLDSGLDAEGMDRALQEFVVSAEELGAISVSRDQTRYCIRIPEEGVEYVHDKVADPGFLKALLDTIGHCNISMDDILDVFHRFSDHVVCEKMDGGEFDYLVYFEDGTPDDFRYCIKFEGDCAIYHRFNPKDYEGLKIILDNPPKTM